MKNTIAILIALVMMVSCLSLTAFAAEDNEMVPVLVKVPEGWDAPNCWAWADDGTNAFAAWPGEAFEAWEEGWYYIYVPSFVQNIIVNANQGTDDAVQTDGIVVEAGKEVWITVAEDNSAEVSYEAQLRGEIPAYVEKFVVHAYVPLSWKTVNMWAWSAPDGTNAFEAWPGEGMVEGDDGWFTGKAPTWINSLIINGNEGSVQTEDISVEGKELWITVYEDLTYDLSYEDPNKAVPNITVHAQVPDDWSAPCCWAWSAPDGTNAFSSWPGEALTQDGDWYTIEVPGWINSVIINGNEGSVQTSDLSVEAGKDVWVVVTDPENATVSYEEPAIEVVPDETEAPTTEAPATDAPAEEPAQESGSSTAIIIGVIVAVVIVAGVAAVVIKKKKK
ncbi:MAG: starch-binding protein [Firmicutes bacterium]|nr:starch-binding protein [Clostridiales bacterium]MDD7341240.1 starch-binding protein [Bacillota bacterium]